MNKEQLITELINCLPNKRIREAANNLAVEHPFTKELIFLKQRPGCEDIPISDYITYAEEHDLRHFYGELNGKSVILDSSLLGQRGKWAFFENWIIK